MVMCIEWSEFSLAYHTWNGDPEEANKNSLRGADFAVVAYIEHLLIENYLNKG